MRGVSWAVQRGAGSGPTGRRPIRPAALLALLVLTVAGCADEPPMAAEQQRAVLEPTGTPSPAVRPRPDGPADSRTVQGQGFSLRADSSFQQQDRTARNGQPLLLLEHASGVPEIPARVAVLREAEARQGVVEQSYALEVTKRSLHGATDITRSSLTWPGVRRTVLVQWTEPRPTAEGRSVPVRYWQLNAQVSSRLILVVVGYAPAAEFDTSGIAEVVQSFRTSG